MGTDVYSSEAAVIFAAAMMRALFNSAFDGFVCICATTHNFEPPKLFVKSLLPKLFKNNLFLPATVVYACFKKYIQNFKRFLIGQSGRK